MKHNYKKILFLLMVFIIFILFYVLNSKTFLALDDYSYHYVFMGRMPKAPARPISNVLDIFESMANHWKLWGGRVVVHFLLQLALLCGVKLFNIVNSIMFVLLGILIYKHATNKNDKDINLFLYIFIYGIMFLFIPQPGATVLWKSGSANYLWSACLMLVMTLFYKRHYENEEFVKDNKKNMVLLFLYGLIAGCTNENTGCALIVLEILYMFIYKHKYKKVPKWAITAFVGTLIGYVFLVIAPGNYARADEMYDAVDYSILGLLSKTLELSRLSLKYLQPIFAVLVITSVAIFDKKDKFNEIREKYINQIFYLIFAVISIYSLVMSPAYPERCWFFPFVFLLIICSINVTKLDFKNILVSKVCVIFIVLMSVYGLNYYVDQYNYINETYNELSEHKNYIESKKKDGEKNIIIYHLYRKEGRYNVFSEHGYLSSNPESWVNRWIATYYGVDSIIALD